MPLLLCCKVGFYGLNQSWGLYSLVFGSLRSKININFLIFLSPYASFRPQSNPFPKPALPASFILYISLKNYPWYPQNVGINCCLSPSISLLSTTSPFLPFLEKDPSSAILSNIVNPSWLTSFFHSTIRPQSSRKVVNTKMTLPELSLIGRRGGREAMNAHVSKEIVPMCLLHFPSVAPNFSSLFWADQNPCWMSLTGGTVRFSCLCQD